MPPGVRLPPEKPMRLWTRGRGSRDKVTELAWPEAWRCFAPCEPLPGPTRVAVVASQQPRSAGFSESLAPELLGQVRIVLQEIEASGLRQATFSKYSVCVEINPQA